MMGGIPKVVAKWWLIAATGWWPFVFPLSCHYTNFPVCLSPLAGFNHIPLGRIPTSPESHLPGYL